ncbi:Uncharacterised protein [uncultured archaeon]|nr:Uncharacterised protein [uncultured archaeon]
MKSLKWFFLVFLIASLSFASAALGVTSYSISPSSIKPGSSGKAVITLTNNGDTTASQVIIGYSNTLGSYGNTYTDSLSVGDIAAKGSTIVTIPFSVPASLPAKIYSFSFNIYFQSTTSGTSTSGGSVPISVTNPPILSFITENVSTPVVSPSSSFIIHAKVTNSGGPASNVQLFYGVDSLFSSSTGNTFFIGNIDSNKQISVDLPLTAASNIPQGVYSIVLNYSYDDSNGASSTSQASFGPIIAAQLANDLTAKIDTKNLVQPGGVADVDVVLTNLQDQTLSNIVVSLSSNNSNYVVLDGNDKSVDSLGPKAQVRVPFKVGINPASFSSFYPVDILISYVSPSRGGSSIVKTGGIQISGASSFDIVSSTVPSPLAADNQVYSISLKVSNTGNSPVRALSVKVDSDFLNFIGDNGDYIGTLNLDDFSTVSLDAVVKDGTTTGMKNLKVHITYKDTYNQAYTDDQIIPIQVYSSQDAAQLSGKSSGSAWFYVIIILVIAAAVVWFVIRRKKNKS